MSTIIYDGIETRAEEIARIKRGLKMAPSIQLHTGGYFDFLEPEKCPLDIEDIASPLSKLCRFTGHLKPGVTGIYTVGQHSVLASENTDGDPFEALMHDRTEAVLNDISTPLKQLLPEYKAIEEHVEAVTAKQYGLPHPMTASCKAIDIRMLATEKRDIMVEDEDGGYWKLLEGIDPLPFTIELWSPEETRHRFLQRYSYLKYGIVPNYDDPYAEPHKNAPADYVEACRKAWGKLHSDKPAYFDANQARALAPHRTIDYAELYERIARRIQDAATSHSQVDIKSDLPPAATLGFSAIVETVKAHLKSLGFEATYDNGGHHGSGGLYVKW